MPAIFYRFLRWCPGGLGIFLRQKFYPYLLGTCGKKVLFGRFVNIENPEKIHLGDHVVINDKVTLDAGCFHEQGAAIMLGDKVFIGAGSLLHTEVGNGRIVLRSGCSIGSFCVVKAKGDITIGEDVLLAAYCKIGNCSAECKGLLQDKVVAVNTDNDIEIESGCWLGVRSTVMPGVIVGEGSIVGAHAVVRHVLPRYVVAVGVPAKVIRNRLKSQY
ncbi:MAG: acyltransferase [Thermodesulfobacteriota bacterium]